ncbi:MAG: hypothetical protein Q9200_000008 [Gallowayella weberi]
MTDFKTFSEAVMDSVKPYDIESQHENDRADAHKFNQIHKELKEKDYPEALYRCLCLRCTYLTFDRNSSRVFHDGDESLTFWQATMFWKASMILMVLLPMKNFAPLLINQTYESLKALEGSPDDKALMDIYRKLQPGASRNIGDAVLSSRDYDSKVRRHIQHVDWMFDLFDGEHARLLGPGQDPEVAGVMGNIIKLDKGLLELRRKVLAHHKRTLWIDASRKYIMQDLDSFSPFKQQ